MRTHKSKKITAFFLKIIENVGCFLSKVGTAIEGWAWKKSPRMKEINEEIKNKREMAMEDIKTPFGKEKEKLIVEHQKIIEEEKEKKQIKMWIYDVLNDYDELIRKYRGLLPLDSSTKYVPNEAYTEEGREIEVNMLHCFPSNCKREDIVHHVTEMIKHIQEFYYPQTPVWVEIIQHKEKNRNK